jgi:tRNA dimethylallyltransferase
MRGYALDLPSMSGVGYKQLGSYLSGESTLEEAVEKTKTETHRLIRHQNAWFKANDPRIDWYDISGNYTSAVTERVTGFISETRK